MTRHVDVDALRARNEEKADSEAGEGPARAEPDAAPIGDAIEDFHRRDALSFGIPAHRAGTGDAYPPRQSGRGCRRSAPTPG
jgi:arginine decarboxylase